MILGTQSASLETLQHLPTPVRRKVDAADTIVPEGFEVEPVLAGLNFPIDLTFADDGTMYVAEGGSTWPTRPYMPSRLLEIKPSGKVRVVGIEGLGGLRGLCWRDGQIYGMAKGGYFSRLVRYDAKTGERTVLLETMPNGGWHEPGGPLFGPDGLIYFSQGSVALQGVVLPYGFTVDIIRHPLARDIPGADVTLTGNNVWSRDPISPYPFYVETGAFKPFRTPARQGEVIKGELWCTTGVWRAKPDGTEPELVAWGIRNPFGMTMTEEGDLYITDNDFEEKGDRAIGEDPDRVWHVPSAKQPHGTIGAGKAPWYGFPDISADGYPVYSEHHIPNRGNPAKPLIENPPEWAGPPAFLFDPHTGMGKLDYCASDAFGHRGELFVCLWGTLAPLNSIRETEFRNGFSVVRGDPKTGDVHPFFHNPEKGPASAQAASGGLERPVSCRFHPDGRTLYVLDFGHSAVTPNLMVSYAHTGVLWKITRTNGGVA